MDKLEEKVDKVGTAIATLQSESESKNREYGEKVAELDGTLLNIKTDVANLVESLQNSQNAESALQQEVKELALSIAKRASKDPSSQASIADCSDEVKSQLETALREAKGTYAINRDAAKSIITDLVGKQFPHLSEEKAAEAVKNILSEGSNPAGGIFCPTPMDSRIRTRMYETSPIRQFATVMNTTTQAMSFTLDDEDLLVAKAAEGDTRNETNVPSFGQVKIDVNEIYARPKATLEILEDSTFDLAGWLDKKVAKSTGLQQNTAFLLGTGDKEARGILDYASAAIDVYSRGKLGTMNTATADKLVADDLIRLQSHLLPEYDANARFMMNKLTFAEIAMLKDQNDNYLINPSMLTQGYKGLTLLGAPVVMAADMPKPEGVATFTTGTIPVLYGDFAETYTILDRLGINVIMNNITQPGFVTWYFRSRYGAGVTNFQSMKRLAIA